MSHRHAEECPACGAEIEVELVLAGITVPPGQHWLSTTDVPSECPECGGPFDGEGLRRRAIEWAHDPYNFESRD